ncbi:MAG: prephenate dehydratase [Candidatus Omnitrophota bacterium]|jgi:chorismate mutase/prephenate dehydratase
MLNKLRNKIDAIDNDMLKLLNRRAEEVIEVSKLKVKNNLSAYSAEREINILKRLKSLNNGPLSSCDVENIFKEILSACRALKTVLRVAYLGPKGTFTQLAAIKNFGKSSEYISVESISDVFSRVEKGEAQYGVVPIENSTEGVINHTLDMFFDSNLKICSEITLNVAHVLVAAKNLPLKKIKRVYSKSQVFPQCRLWLASHLPGVELIPMSSTAKAAITIKKDLNGAAIGNKILAQSYGLKMIASGLEDSSSNLTRFLIISKNDSKISGNDKTSILCSAKDRVGALHDVLYIFKKYRINLTKIESRPSKKKPWEYYFFIDFEGHRSLPNIQKVLKELEKKCIFVKILGSYPKEA